MYETMYNAQGVGLAAPQIARSIRLFIVDASPFADEEEEDFELLKGFKKTFINPIIIEESGDEWEMEEGEIETVLIPEEAEPSYGKEFSKEWL